MALASALGDPTSVSERLIGSQEDPMMTGRGLNQNGSHEERNEFLLQQINTSSPIDEFEHRKSEY